ncbi:DUF2628 domain-containing protein [Hyphomicrobium album]|uniref:DUF2628 domain-containing protein n=1 Tax=Hyphomicrobium album TaxID=2665159 RepID=UPI0018AC8842|nr:DUF2628 domain-containing protein [Hyphomicrobium album]
MVTYTVYEPPHASANRLESAEQLVFVKDGYTIIGALLPPIWLLAKRMWLEFAVYIGGSGLLVWALTSAGATELANVLVLIIQIVFGFEAGALYGAALERRGWRLVGTVTGRGQEDSERRFLEVWLPTRTEIPPAPLGAATPAAPSWTATALTRAKETIVRGRRAWAGAQT